MKYEDKKLLFQKVFAGKDDSGRRLGVYVKKSGNNLSYTIRGKLVDEIIGYFPMLEDEVYDILNVPMLKDLPPEDFSPPLDPESYKALMDEQGNSPLKDINLFPDDYKETPKGVTSYALH